MKRPSAVEIAVVVVIVVILLALAPTRSDTTWIDPITGSIKHQENWFIVSGPARVNRSPIEDWIIRHEASYIPQWKFLTCGTKTFFGRGMSRGCSLAPPIYPMHRPEQASSFLRASSDAEIARFVQVMRTGTKDEQQAAVDAALERTFVRK